MKRILLLFCCVALGAQAEIVHVYEQTMINGRAEILTDRTVETGVKLTSQKAPVREGFIFTHWSISTKQAFENRLPWQCAYNYVEFIPYEATILTANYVAETLDSDADGMPDGYELYWYGNLSQRPTDDTDGDGYTFAQEVQYGMNPHFFDEEIKAGVVRVQSVKMLYNPFGYRSYTVMSDPESELFETYTGWARPGTVVSSPKCNRLTTTFAFWKQNGVDVRNEFGRALDQASFVMADEDVVLVAVCKSDPDLREQYYWYGQVTSLDSDTDEDGFYLFEEIAMGSSPLFPDEHLKGVVWQDSEKLLYNPYCYQPYTVRCEPEGTLFETSTEWVRPGTLVETKKLDHLTSSFAQWLMNGTRQQDEFGRAIPQVSLAMPSNAVELVAETQSDETTKEKIYWYGNTSVSLDSDTDGDGFTFADELAQGTSPLFANETVKAGVVWKDVDVGEVNLQPYEQVLGAIVGSQYVEMFLSPTFGNAATSSTFADGAQVWPVVTDIDGDGRWDLLVCSAVGTVVYRNIGSSGNPEFVRAEDGKYVVTPEIRQMNSTDKLAGLSLDIAPLGALSATTNGATLLVSDDEGRIWYYDGGVLQHKVWGGSHPGFANGLRLAVVDWEDDGDLDCVCGTADGKLMLLRNPKVGRPTNVRLLAGVDNVVLEWDPNVQSRIRGYNVYRSVADADSFGKVASETPIPRYRDLPETIQDYDYKVTSVSRFYRAGNSIPIVSESMATEPMRASLGKVALLWGDASGFVGDEIAVRLGVENSMNLSGSGLSLAVAFDSSVLRPVRVETSGLTEGLVLSTNVLDDVWTVQSSDGTIAAGGGTLVTFVFSALAENDGTSVALQSFSAKAVSGAAVTPLLPSRDARVIVIPFEEPDPAHATVSLTETVQAKSGESFTLTVTAAGENVRTDSLTYDYVYDSSLFVRNGDTFEAKEVAKSVVSVITLTNVSVLATDGSAAQVDSVGTCSVVLAPRSGEDIDDGGDDEEEVDEDIVRDDDGEIVDWCDEPGEDDPAYRYGFHVAHIRMESVSGNIGDVVEVPVGLHSVGVLKDVTVNLKRFAFSVRYDERLVEPTGVAAETGTYSWSASNGVMTVIGQGGELALGRFVSPWRTPLKLCLKLREQYSSHNGDLYFKVVQARSTEGRRIYTPVRIHGNLTIKYKRPKDDPSVVTPYGLGDVNGDGRLSKEDLQLLAQLMNGGKKKKWNENQLRAGDYNGNNTLDEDDYQLMREDFRKKGIVNGGEKVGAL